MDFTLSLGNHLRGSISLTGPTVLLVTRDGTLWIGIGINAAVYSSHGLEGHYWLTRDARTSHTYQR